MCSWVVGELEMQRGDFKEARFVIMLLDVIHIEGGGVSSRKIIVWLCCRLCMESGCSRVNIVCVCGLC